METWRIMIVADLCRRKAWHEQLRVAVKCHRPHAVCVMGDALAEPHCEADPLTLEAVAKLLASLSVQHLLFVGCDTHDCAQLQSVWPQAQRPLVVLTESGYSLGPLNLCSQSSFAGPMTGTSQPDPWLLLDSPPSSGGENESKVRCKPTPLLVVCGSEHPGAPRRGVRWSCREDIWHLHFGRQRAELQYAAVSFHFAHAALLGMWVSIFPPK